MGDYIQELQELTGWTGALEPVLKCCIRKGSMKGFCPVCMENFRYRSGSYYKGFIYPDDEDLLERLSSGLKPFGGFARRECDEDLEVDIADSNLHLVRASRNSWGMMVYDVVKDPKLKLSDLADIPRMSEALGFEVKDRRLVDLEGDDHLTFAEIGLKYGYPFYTIPRRVYGIST